MATSDSPLSVPNITLAVARQSGGVSGDWTAGQPPVIESVSGTFQVGQQATISVSNLSAKRNGQLYFENAEGFAVGADFFGGQLVGNNETLPYVVSDDSALFGSRFARRVATQQSLTATAVDLAGSYRDLFFEAWQRFVLTDFTSSPDGPQVKNFRFVSDDAAWDLMGRPDFGSSFNAAGDHTIYQRQTDGGANSETGYAVRPSQNQWFRITQYLLWSDAGVANGKRYFKTSADQDISNGSYPAEGHWASPAGVVAPAEWDGEEIVTDNGSGGTGTSHVVLPFYTRSDQTTTMDVDRLFINDSPERVMVGDASTWIACDPYKAFILPQVTRDNGEVVVDIDALGPLATGPVYLYVCNQDGLYNEVGYEWRAS